MDSSRKKFMVMAFTGIGLVALVLAVVIVVIKQSDSEQTIADRIENLLLKTPIIDGHNDFPWNTRNFLYNDISNLNFNDLTQTEPWNTSDSSHTDLIRLKAGHVGGQFWVAYTSCATTVKDAVPQVLEQIDVIHRLIEKYPNDLKLAVSSEDIENAFAEGKIASLIGVEGGHMIQFSYGILRTLYALGTRYLTLTHNCNTPWADNANVDRINGPDKPFNDGLSDFGLGIIEEMNRLGMMIDLSHVSAATMLDAIDHSEAPVMFSHSNAYTICPHHRNVRDHILELIKNGKDGIIMVNFYNYFVSCDGNISTIDNVIEHIEYLRNMTSADNIGLGGDFDGMDMPAIGLENVSKYPEIFKILAERGWSDEDMEKLASKNLIRIFKKVEMVRDSMANRTPKQASLTTEDIAKYNVSTSCITAKFPSATATEENDTASNGQRLKRNVIVEEDV